jgi:hypothetical protein
MVVWSLVKVVDIFSPIKSAPEGAL